MPVVLYELQRQRYVGVKPDNQLTVDDTRRLVLQVSQAQFQMTRSPTVITIPGDQDSGDAQIIGFDIGMVSEQITLSGMLDTQQRNVLSTDPAYNNTPNKIYPSMTQLRSACLTWWHDVDWATIMGSSAPLCSTILWTPGGQDYRVIVQQAQFSEDPGIDMYSFSLVLRVIWYPPGQ